MKTFVYIGIIGASALLLASCKGKSKPMETPVPSISVSTPIVRDITLTKEYPGYLSSQLKVDLVARVNGYLRTSYLKAGSRVKKVVLLDASLHIAQADVVAGNALSATIIYVVHEDKLWAYSWDGNNEYEIPLPGVEGKLDYLSNQFLKVGSFGVKTENYDALIVGTTEAEKYNLYIFDNMVGGAPQEAVEPYRGVGRVKSVRYVPSISVSLTDFMMAMSFGPIAPWTD